MDAIVLRAPVEGDVEAIARVVDAQDTAWWGEPDGDLDDVRDELERVRRAMGSLDVGARVAVVEGSSSVSRWQSATVTPASPSTRRTGMRRRSGGRCSNGWPSFGDDVQIESPAQDAERLVDLDSLGFRPCGRASNSNGPVTPPTSRTRVARRHRAGAVPSRCRRRGTPRDDLLVLDRRARSHRIARSTSGGR